MKTPLIVLLLLAAACDAAPPPGSRPAAVREAPLDTDSVDVLLRVRPDGIGHAAAGFTVADLRRALPPDARIGELDQYFMVDVTAAPIILGGDTLYYLLFSPRETLEDTVTLEMVASLNPGAKTTDGIGAGMTLAAAAAASGEPTLSYNTNDESREYAQFPSQPSTVLFRVRPREDGSLAGVYATSGEYNTTTQYDPAATIFMVMVVLRTAPR